MKAPPIRFDPLEVPGLLEKARAGIYKIINILNGKVYIGSAKNFQHRWSRHVSALNLDKHENLHLQNAWNKYGSSNFKLETKGKLRESNIGKKRSPETVENNRQAQLKRNKEKRNG